MGEDSKMKKFYIAKIKQFDGNHEIIIPTKNKYIVVNVDEPYAIDVYHMIRNNELKKGNTDMPEDFEEFIHQIGE